MSRKNCVANNFLLCDFSTMTFGEQLKEIREKRGLTLQEVADAVGVSYQAIQNYESGKSKPRADKLPILAKFLDVDINFLLQEPVDFPCAVEGLRPHSAERASKIYQCAGAEYGFEGMHWFTEQAIRVAMPPGVNEYLSKKINDAELYSLAKKEMGRLYRLAIRHFKKWGR